MPITIARQRQACLQGSKEEMLTTLVTLAQEGPTAMFWAPADLVTNGRLMEAFRAMRPIQPFKLFLVVGAPPLWGATHVDALLELWSHPALNSRLQDHHTSYTMSTPPSRVVQSGAMGPLWSTKSIIEIEVGDADSLPRNEVWAWGTALFDYSTAFTVVVDVAIVQLRSQERELRNIELYS